MRIYLSRSPSSVIDVTIWAYGIVKNILMNFPPPYRGRFQVNTGKNV